MSLFIAAALLLGYFVPGIAERRFPHLASPIGVDQAIAFLSAVASGMMTFTGVVFSLVLVALQFVTAAYTPRIVSTWLSNHIVGDSCGVFTGTFLYSLMALRGVGSLHGGESSSLVLWVAFVWLLGSVYMLVRLIAAFADLTHTRILYMVAAQGRAAIDGMRAPADAGAPPPGLAPGARSAAQQVVHDGQPAYLVSVDVARLVALARSAGATIRVPFAVGDPVPAGAPIALVHGARAPVSERAIRRAVVLGREREVAGDPKYALRLLVDIAIRALSPAVVDPTTAVQALDHVEALLVRLGNTGLGAGQVRDGEGVVRLVYEPTTWDEYLELALAEIQYYGATSVQVQRRLAALVAFVSAHVPPARRVALARFADEQRCAVRREFPASEGRARAERSDRQGLGHDARASDGG
ncbi:MAG TPA: DUF2254 domain-containing protein [Polyangiaceae bacterium]|nr:DUF2254 domain-containing protein [Polyangiaceae bacterium]